MPNHKRALAALALVLASVAGGVDAVGWLTLDHLFTAHMSGNTVAMTVTIALGDWSEAGRRAFVIGAFLTGIAVGAAAATLAHRMESRASFSIVLAFECVLLVTLMVIGAAATRDGVSPHQGGYWPLVLLAAMPMGMQSATLRRAGRVRARTTYMTGVLTRFVENLVMLAACSWDRHKGRPDHEKELHARAQVATLSGVWLSYATGGVACGLLVRWIGWLALLLPVTSVAAAIVLDVSLARSGVEGAGPEEG
jgi:uncharacterized membrane protein YoaK (UPF0700 family)